MVKQLGISTIFITLSCVDLLWNKLFLIIAEVRGEVLPKDSINDFFETFLRHLDSLISIQYFFASHFQYRIETFFKVIVLKVHLVKVNSMP